MEVCKCGKGGNSLTNFEKIKAMHEGFGTVDPKHPVIPPKEILELRAKLIFEECKELLYELGFEIGCINYDCPASIINLYPIEVEFDLEKIAKESADLKVVTYGTDASLGIDADAAFDAVNTSNMSKIGPNGETVRREDSKILKGSHYVEADMSVIWRNND